MLDKFVQGDVHRISPESPVPVLSVTRETTMPGGAGNVISNLRGLNIKTDVIAVIGDDYNGQILSGLVDALGIDPSHLIARDDAPTTLKTRFLSGHQQMLRVDHEVTSKLTTDAEDKIIAAIEKLVPSQNALILSDYGKGVLTDKILRHAITLANKQGIPVLIDPKGNNYAKYSGATVITPNRKELSEATGNSAVKEDEDIITAATSLIQSCAIKSVVATRSQDGMSIIQTGVAPVHLRTHAREVFDVSGAGDTVISTIAAGLAAGATLVEAASLANIAGGIVVGKVGTTPIRAKELVEALNDPDAVLGITPAGDRAAIDRSRRAQITDWDEALEQVERWRARGLKVGFTNGCFDILHAGHVNYLNEARNRCDRLVLGLNNDRSIRLLKGPTRPVNDELSRATVIGALGAIDMVVFFGAENEGDDNTAGNLIRHLKPDLYFKGNDYTIDQLPEAKIMASFGGKIELIPLTEGLSTTKTIEKMSKKDAAA
jgi:D-beta-D-heptose 7-phosphate kinase/D-beta-D-heptose 1-phosphate adenosyltransferase